MTLKDNWKYRLRPVLGCLQDFIIQVGMTLKTIPAEVFKTEEQEDANIPNVGIFLAAVAAIMMIALVFSGVVAIIMLCLKVL